jgi:hypothetical protein
MDIHQLKQRIDALGKKLATLGNEYIKSKDEIAARKVLVKMFGEISQQTLLLGEQSAQMDRSATSGTDIPISKNRETASCLKS